jgi:polyisoprenoid-binding protein YceI
MLQHGHPHTGYYALRFLLLLVCLSGLSQRAHAETFSYYAPPTQTNATLQLTYSNSYSADYVALNPNPLARFNNATASFYYDGEHATLANLRIAMAASSLVTTDAGYKWILIGSAGLDINRFEEVTLTVQPPATLTKNNPTKLEGFLTIRGITAKAIVETQLDRLEDKSIVGRAVGGNKGEATMTVTVTFKCADFGMAPVDSDNRVRGDLGVLKIELRALRQ